MMSDEASCGAMNVSFTGHECILCAKASQHNQHSSIYSQIKVFSYDISGLIGYYKSDVNENSVNLLMMTGYNVCLMFCNIAIVISMRKGSIQM